VASTGSIFILSVSHLSCLVLGSLSDVLVTSMQTLDGSPDAGCGKSLRTRSTREKEQVGGKCHAVSAQVANCQQDEGEMGLLGVKGR
jgi:hypothetical protein